MEKCSLPRTWLHQFYFLLKVCLRILPSADCQIHARLRLARPITLAKSMNCSTKISKTSLSLGRYASSIRCWTYQPCLFWPSHFEIISCRSCPSSAGSVNGAAASSFSMITSAASREFGPSYLPSLSFSLWCSNATPKSWSRTLAVFVDHSFYSWSLSHWQHTAAGSLVSTTGRISMQVPTRAVSWWLSWLFSLSLPLAWHFMAQLREPLESEQAHKMKSFFNQKFYSVNINSKRSNQKARSFIIKLAIKLNKK